MEVLSYGNGFKSFNDLPIVEDYRTAGRLISSFADLVAIDL
jgi:hypothetical protein